MSREGTFNPAPNELPAAVVHVLVLAAGRGTRMGGPKALMDVGGRPWWRWQCERLRAIGFATTWVVSVEVAGAGADLGQVVEANPHLPMFESLRAGVNAIGGGVGTAAGGGVFVLPVDVPVPSRAVWLALRAAPCPAVPSYRGRRGHPVFLPAAWLAGHPLTSGRRLDEMIREAVVEIPVDDPDVAVNLNTPEDVQNWLVRGRLHRGEMDRKPR